MDTLMLVVMAMSITFGLVFAISDRATDSGWEKQIIQRDFGLYCPDTGDFAFVGEAQLRIEKCKVNYSKPKKPRRTKGKVIHRE